MMDTLTETEHHLENEEAFNRLVGFLKRNGYERIENCYWVEVYKLGSRDKAILYREF